MTDRDRLDENVRPDPDVRGHLDVRALRMEVGPGRPADQFCLLCDCIKSGKAAEPNIRGGWCADPKCPCHDEELA